MNLRAGSLARRGNDSSNIKNLLFGGYDEPTPPKAHQFYPAASPSSASTDLLSPSQPIPHKAQTLHSTQDNKVIAASMSEIEAKINSKLQEIESLFSDKTAPHVPPPVIIKNSSSLVQSGISQMAAGEGAEEQKKAPIKGVKGNARQQSTSAQERKQEAISKVMRQNSTTGKRQYPEQNAAKQTTAKGVQPP
jgi:hypothetical protein